MKKFVINFFASLFATIILFGLLLFICLITPISLIVIYYIDVIYIKLFLILIFVGFSILLIMLLQTLENFLTKIIFNIKERKVEK